MRFPSKSAVLLLLLAAWMPSRAQAQVSWYGIRTNAYCGYVSNYGPYGAGFTPTTYAYPQSYFSASYYGGLRAYPPPPYVPSYYTGRAYAQPDFASGGSFYTPGSYAVPFYSRPSYYYGTNYYAPGFYNSYYFRP